MNNNFVYYLYLLKHKILVFLNIWAVITKLFKRALCHDNSKLRFSEAKKTIPLVKESIVINYDSPEYKDFLNKNKDALQLHYSRSDHHPEHFNSYKDMPMVALIEMVSDWKAATKKNPNGDLNKSFEIAKKRHNMSDEIITFLKTL